MGARDEASERLGLPAKGQESGKVWGGTISPREGPSRKENKLLEGGVDTHALHK